MDDGIAELIIFFDGVCNLCNASVDFFMKMDRCGTVKFSSLQGAVAAELLPRHGLDPSKLDSILFFENGRISRESTAVLRILGHMGGFWPLAKVFLLVPRFLRDAIYRCIARNRYKWFGKADTCRLPTKSEAKRFLS